MKAQENLLMPKTEKYLKRMEDIFAKYGNDLDSMKDMLDEEEMILCNPMLHLAEAIYMDTYGWRSDSWMHQLRDYLNVLCQKE